MISAETNFVMVNIKVLILRTTTEIFITWYVTVYTIVLKMYYSLYTNHVL
jgi:hypothetical protein